jgi:hypothetical protein
MEIILLIVSIGMSLTTFTLTLWYRELQRQLKIKDELLSHKTKLSNDVLAVLNDMKQGGAVFEVTRIDRSDIFFHNGSQYR